MAIFITGDTHADFHRFNMYNFPEQCELTLEDKVIICGDFGGIWNGSKEENYWLNWLGDKHFTICFVDGNHENFDMLEQFEIVDFCSGKAHKIRDNIFHLCRGEIFEFEGQKFWCFGGARSHDVGGGIFEPDEIEKIVRARGRWLSGVGESFRVNHESWWVQEMPTVAEMHHGMETLEKNNFDVDFIISHDAPMNVLATRWPGCIEPDGLNTFFDEVSEKTNFRRWFIGHHHVEEQVMEKFIFCYEKIFQIL